MKHIEAAKINSKEDFITFLKYLSKDLEVNGKNWVNTTLTDYFDAMTEWTEDSEGYYENMKIEIPRNVPWNVFADILIAATMYE